ncbi:ActS/PrrB/RegB family redox-sensitive histidine kinase [Pelagibacteraceae bacterium]|jgi:two-component system sensor histidine kinase RegB|nr:ActS/PrrB/RegB family redox-sensitive histidine kinase [Pelagibacteraceae bacterium]
MFFRERINPQGLRITLETLINIRWIAIVGQFFTVSVVEYFLKFEFPYFGTLTLIFLSALVNVYLEINKSKFLTINNFYATLSIFYDLVQLILLLFMTGGLSNPFSILIIVPTTISVTYLSRGSSQFIVTCSIIFSTVIAFYHMPLPYPVNESLVLPKYYNIGLWLSLGIGIIFLGNYAYQLGRDNRVRSTALSRLEEELTKEKVVNSVGGMAAAAVHELATPLATISLVSKELQKQLKDNSNIKEDINLLIEQSERCSSILKDIAQRKQKDEFIENISPKELINEIVFSLNNISNKEINVENLNLNQRMKMTKKTEISYALRNFIENSIKFAKNKINIEIDQNKKRTAITISDDGDGFNKDIIANLGQPYLHSDNIKKNKKGMGLGVFISKSLLERCLAQVTFRNNKSLPGASVKIVWNNSQLENL